MPPGCGWLDAGAPADGVGDVLALAVRPGVGVPVEDPHPASTTASRNRATPGRGRCILDDLPGTPRDVAAPSRCHVTDTEMAAVEGSSGTHHPASTGLGRSGYPQAMARYS